MLFQVPVTKNSAGYCICGQRAKGREALFEGSPRVRGYPRGASQKPSICDMAADLTQ